MERELDYKAIGKRVKIARIKADMKQEHVAEKSGLIRKLTGFLSPFVTFMFPRIPKGHKARDYISTNIIANA